MKKQSTILLGVKQKADSSDDNLNTRDILFKERIIKILKEETIDRKEMMDLCFFYVKEVFPEARVSKLFMYNTFVKRKDRRQELLRLLEHARVYFKKKYGLEPRFHTGNLSTKVLEEGTLVYDINYNLYVWNGKNYDEVEYYKKPKSYLFS